jgi:hypothetical protein
MSGKLTFAHLLGAVVAVSFIAGFAVFILSGAVTDKGTSGAIGAERATIMAAEKTSCMSLGRYGSVATLRSEGLLTFKPVYNSVVYLYGPHCGTIVIGSPAYHSPAS